jgi:hypothetical protein
VSPLDIVLAVRRLTIAEPRMLAAESDVSYMTLRTMLDPRLKRGPTMIVLQKLWLMMDDNPKYVRPLPGRP